MATLTVLQRTGMAASEELGYDDLTAGFRALVDKFKQGSKDASAELRHWIKLLAQDTEPEEEGADFARMSPGKRAVLRARVLRILEDEGSVDEVIEEANARTESPASGDLSAAAGGILPPAA